MVGRGRTGQWAQAGTVLCLGIRHVLDRDYGNGGSGRLRQQLVTNLWGCRSVCGRVVAMSRAASDN